MKPEPVLSAWARSLLALLHAFSGIPGKAKRRGGGNLSHFRVRCRIRRRFRPGTDLNHRINHEHGRCALYPTDSSGLDTSGGDVSAVEERRGLRARCRRTVRSGRRNINITGNAICFFEKPLMQSRFSHNCGIFGGSSKRRVRGRLSNGGVNRRISERRPDSPREVTALTDKSIIKEKQDLQLFTE